MGKNQLLFQTGRYSAYLIPMFVLIAIMGIVWLRGWVSGRYPRLALRLGKRLVPVSALVMPAFVLGAAVFFCLGHRAMAERYAWQVQNINAMQVELGKWAAALPRNTVLAVNDAGAIPFFSRKQIIDTVGVVNPEVLGYLKKYPPKRGGRDRGLLEYLEMRKPDYVIIFPSWYKRLSARTDILCPIKSITLAHNVVCGGGGVQGRTMVVYRPVWKAN